MAKGKKSTATKQSTKIQNNAANTQNTAAADGQSDEIIFQRLTPMAITIGIIAIIFFVGFRILSVLLIIITLVAVVFIYSLPPSDVTGSALQESNIDQSNAVDFGGLLAASPGGVASGPPEDKNYLSDGSAEDDQSPPSTKRAPIKRKRKSKQVQQEFDDDSDD